jgi:isopentenyl diphosphate isomerase/L-lactate dehydrogenase-like FMN-dependent dehydrogenase
LNDIERLATQKMSKKAWAYFFSASDDLYSKNLNNQVYKSILLRPRVFINCEKCDTSTRVLGQQLGTPLFVSPGAMARLGHPAGERGIAEGISRFGALQIISNYSSMSPEQIVADSAPTQTFGWQLYISKDRSKSERMLARIEALGDKVKFICLTLDSPVSGKREHDERVGKTLQTQMSSTTLPGSTPTPLFMGPAGDLTWTETLDWLLKHTTMPIVLKGIQTHEDALLAMQSSPRVQGILLSNHGGRSADTAPPALHTLLEIRKYCPQVFSKLEVYVDGGIKRGTDVVKALCLGAKAVGVGRAALFGLGAGGVKGVERTFESKFKDIRYINPLIDVVLQGEIETCMRLLGVEKVEDLCPQHVSNPFDITISLENNRTKINSRVLEREIFDGISNQKPLALVVEPKL